jgi:secreted PhoX family phosphatase
MTIGRSQHIRTLLEQRLTRRAVLGGACGVAALSIGAPRAWSSEEARGALRFARVAPSRRDTVIVPEGYTAHTVLRWGDPLHAGAPALDPAAVAAGALLAPGAAAAQERQFGYNCDGIGLFARGERSLLICVNHEYPSPDLLFPGWNEARQARAVGDFVRSNRGIVSYMQAALGVSVVELERGRTWRYRVGSRYNRRITANTPIELAGPARDHPLLNPRGDAVPIALGTFGNCAAGTTPWGTYLTAEENVDDHFGNFVAAEMAPQLAAIHERFGLRLRDSAYRWEYGDPRFDAAANPAESLRFGWIVEIDPFDPESRPRKRTALGRLKHECATTVLARDGRAVVYTGDDQGFEYLYKFVSSRRFEPERKRDNAGLLDEGTLHVARFADDGTGEWLPLVFGDNPELTPARGFSSQGDVVLRCREAADRLGATPLDRPEDIAVHPHDRKVYVSCTMGADRGLVGNAASYAAAARDLDRGADAVNPRAPNPSGHILEITENGADCAATNFRWEIFLLAGSPTADGLLATLPAWHDEPLPPDATYFGGATDPSELSSFANPDNLGFDSAGNLWIVTDGTQPDSNNNGCFVCPTDGPARGQVRQFMCGPVGAEICGCELTADNRTLFLTIQHPGTGGTATTPASHWPDGGGAAPRPSLIAIQADGGGVVGS